MDERDGLLSGFGGIALVAVVLLVIIVAWQISSMPESAGRMKSGNRPLNAHWEQSGTLLLPRKGSRWRVKDPQMRRQLGNPVHVVTRVRVQTNRYWRSPRVDVWFEPETYMGTLRARDISRFLEPVSGP